MKIDLIFGMGLVDLGIWKIERARWDLIADIVFAFERNWTKNIYFQKHGSTNRGNTGLARTINIVDRVMDISKYTQHTPLYAMCRDWMSASASVVEPLPPKLASPRSENLKISEDSTSDVTSMPEPTPLSDEMIDESCASIEHVNEHIRANIRSSQECDLDLIKRLNVDEVLETHALLKLHVNRWKLAKREWFNYYSVQSKPYENSYLKLKSIFEDVL